jgi:hypothetical protein
MGGSRSQRCAEFVRGHPGLAEYATQRADRELVVQRYDASHGSSGRFPPQHHMTPTLPHLSESQPLECLNDIAPGRPGESRHRQRRRTS